MVKSGVIVRNHASTLDLQDSPIDTQPLVPARKTRIRSVGLVLVCTIIGAAAQILMRHGADFLTGPSLVDAITNWSLMAGYACLALNTLLLVLALRDGELSVLYPIIALTYVWVTILSPIFFGDKLNAYKVAGVALIVLGVSFIGKGSEP